MTPKEKQIECLDSLDKGTASVEAHGLIPSKIVIHPSIYSTLNDYMKRTKMMKGATLINEYKGIPLEVNTELNVDTFLIETQEPKGAQ